MITFFKPNKSNKGSAFQLYPANKNDRKGTNYPELSGDAFIKLTHQYSWDDKKKIGRFKENFEDKSQNIILMINQIEIAEIISCIREKRAINHANIDYSSFDTIKATSKEASFYHKTPTTSKVLKFYPRHQNCEKGEFFLGLSDFGANIHVSMVLSSAEAGLLEEALVGILQSYFRAEAERAVVGRVKSANKNNSDGSGKRDIQEKRGSKSNNRSNSNDLEDDDYDDGGSESEETDDVPF